MKANPKVSVLIPTYNYAHFLDETIQSVLDQTFIDFELVIVDNCSTDNTDEVVKKYLADTRVSFYRNETNIGLVGNWNKCLDYAKGEYIKYLCADDKFRPELLEKFVAIMDQNPGVSIMSSYVESFGLISCCRISAFKGKISGEQARESLLSPGVRNWLFAPTAVMFRRAGLKVGKFNPELLSLTDLEFYLRQLTLGDCYIIPETLSFIRTHTGMQTSQNKGKKHQKTFERYRFMNFVKKASTSNSPKIESLIEGHIKKRAIRSAAVMYEVLPTIYKKESRNMFVKAFQIGLSEKALFTPILHVLQGKIKIKK